MHHFQHPTYELVDWYEPDTRAGNNTDSRFGILKHISLERVEFPLGGSPGSQGMALGDLNGDGNIELVVGTVDGMLSVYKHTLSKALYTINRLGTILCISIMKLCPDSTFIVVLSAEGWCRLISLNQTYAQLEQCGQPKRLPRNITNMLVHNFSSPESDIHTHLVLGGLDRTIYIYKVCPTSHVLTLLASYRVGHAVTSLAMSGRQSGTEIVAGLSNSTYARLTYTIDVEDTSVIQQYNTTDKDIIHVISKRTGFERSYVTMSRDKKHFAVATQDGYITYCDEWKTPLQLGEMILRGFCMLEDLLCVCTWGGDIYFIDSNRDAVRYSLHEPVRSFIYGNYSLSDGKVRDCIFCATFNGTIIMCSNISYEIKVIKASRLMESPIGSIIPNDDDDDSSNSTIDRLRCLVYDTSPKDIKLLQAYKLSLEKKLKEAEVERSRASSGL